MKTLILYRSFYGNTKQVAEAIAQEIRAAGHESAVQDVRIKLPALQETDAVFVGAPTRMGRANHKALRAIKRLKKMGFAADKPVVIFDTFGPLPASPEEREKDKKWIYPGAAGSMQKAAINLGLKVYPEPLRCEVQGMKGPLADKVLEQVASFTRGFVSALGKK
jgi:menaquinone-dependent protoporphyrinogen IX oxidase